MLGPCNYLHGNAGTALTAADNYLNLVNTIVVSRELRSFFLCVLSDSFRHIEMSATNCKKQGSSPFSVVPILSGRRMNP